VEKAETLSPAPTAFEPARWSSLLELLAHPATSNPDPTEFFNLFLRHLAGTVSADVALIYGRDEWTHGGSLAASSGFLFDPSERGRELLLAWQSLPGLIAPYGPPLGVADIADDPRFFSQGFSGQIREGEAVHGLFFIPLQFDKKPIGSLVVGFFSPCLLPPDDQAFAIAASRLLISPLVRQARRKRPRHASPFPVVQPTDIKRQHLELLEWAATGIDRFENRSEACDAILAKTMSFAHADEGAVLFAGGPGQRASLVAARGLDKEMQRRAEEGIPPDTTLFQSPSSGGSTDGPPSSADAPPPEPPVVPSPLAMEVQITQHDGSACGILALRRREGEVSQEHQAFVHSAAKVLGGILARFDQSDEATRQAEEAHVLFRLGQTLLRQAHLEPMLAEVADDFKSLFDVTGCAFFSLDKKKNLLCGVATSKPHSITLRKMEFATDASTLVALVAQEKSPLWVENARRDPRVDKRWIGLFRSRSLLGVPMIVNEQVVGVLILDENRRFKTWTPEEVDRVVRFTVPVAQAMENLLQHHRLSSHIDHLQSLTVSVVGLHEEERRRLSRRIHEESTRGLQRLKKEIEKRWVDVAAPALPALPTPAPDTEAGASPVSTPTPGARPLMPPEIRVQIREMEETFQKMAHEIHPPLLDHMGLVPALRVLIDSFSKQARIAVNFQPPGGSSGTAKRFPARIEVLLYRIVQEGLDNVTRHAQAESVILSFEDKGLQVRMTLTDDGKGFDVRHFFESKQRRGAGILWIREYVELNGGKLFIDSAQGRGTRISILLPLARQTGKPGNFQKNEAMGPPKNRPARSEQARPASPPRRANSPAGSGKAIVP
jgi:signal transduction histidine kinase